MIQFLNNSESVAPESTLNPFDVCRKDLHLIGSFSSVNTCMIATDLLKSRVIQADHLLVTYKEEAGLVTLPR